MTTGEAWLDFINPVDVSSVNETHGGLVGDGNALRTDDGDASYVRVSNADDGFQSLSKKYRLTLEPDGTLPPTSRIADFDIRFVGTARLETDGGGVAVNMLRFVDFGFEVVVSCSTTDYLEDFPRGSRNSGPTWDEIRSGGWTMDVQGAGLAVAPLNYLRVTQLRLYVTYELLPIRRRIAHNRGVQRGSDGQGVTGGKRGLQRTSRQSSLRGGSFL